jgi:2-keto-3-deoxy-galactonokinase
VKLAAVTAESISAPVLAMYRQTFESLMHVATLSVQVQRAERSHKRHAFFAGTERIRAEVAMAVERLYRELVASEDDPDTDLDRRELIEDCEVALGMRR